MIDLIQWRASIGLWGGSISSAKKKHTSNIVDGNCSGERNGVTFRTLPALLVLFLSLLLIRSGDVELNPGPTKGPSSREILRSYSATLTDAISHVLPSVTNELYCKGLIPQKTRDYITSNGLASYTKASKLMSVLQGQLEASPDPDQFLIATCHVLKEHNNQSLTRKATIVLQQLGHTEQLVNSLDRHVQIYRDEMKLQYQYQPVVAVDWPPRLGQDFFGKLALNVIERQGIISQREQQKPTRERIDKIPKLSGHEEIAVDDILKPADLSLRIVIDGPPGIGKSSLCRKLLNMWANGQLTSQEYDLMLYCPFRNPKVAQATSLADLFVCQRTEVPIATEWFQNKNGKGLLLIFDGWEELSTEPSLALSIFRREHLGECSVIVASRSYASSSLLKQDFVNRHIQVVGFCKEEIATVIQGKLSDEPDMAKNLISDLNIRDDVHSLCYVPVVCAMVVLVYCKGKGHLPTTLTELYENFILQTVRRHVEKTRSLTMDPRRLYSLHELPSDLEEPLKEICRFAYLSLIKESDNQKMTFTLPQLQQSLDVSIKEEYLGLMTTYTDYDEEIHQFLHLGMQEFLAAWWIVQYGGNAEQVFRDHFNDNRFQMFLKFVAGLTHFEPHENYQQYFNKSLVLQCHRKPFFGFETCRFHQYPQNESSDHCGRYDQLSIFHLQLLYESQNTTICQVLAQSIDNNSLCLHELTLSPFDFLCLSFFIKNSNMTWNHLDLWKLNNQSLSNFTDDEVISNLLQPQIPCKKITNNSPQTQTQCKRFEVQLNYPNAELMHSLSKMSFLRNIQECYCELRWGEYVPCLVLLDLLNLPQITILHLSMDSPSAQAASSKDCAVKYSELEKCLEMKSTLQGIKFEYRGLMTETFTIASVIKGTTRNKTIKSLALDIPTPSLTSVSSPSCNDTPDPSPPCTSAHPLYPSRFFSLPNQFSSPPFTSSYNQFSSLPPHFTSYSRSNQFSPLPPHFASSYSLHDHFFPPHFTSSYSLPNQFSPPPHPPFTSRSYSLPNQFSPPPPSPLSDDAIEHLLKDNCTLQALALNIPDDLLPNIVEVNTPLTALEIGWKSSKLMKSLLPIVKGLHSLILHESHPLPLIFDSLPNLQQLTLPLDTAESVVELFTILQSNTTLKALRVKVRQSNSHMGTSLQDMLTLNQTLQYLEIETPQYDSIPSSYLSYLTNGLIYNTSLEELSVPIPLSTNEQMSTFFDIVSRKNSLTQLQVDFKPVVSSMDSMSSDGSDILYPFGDLGTYTHYRKWRQSLLFGQILPVVTDLLRSHTTIKLLKIVCKDLRDSLQPPNWTEIIERFYDVIFLHPSLEYIEIKLAKSDPLKNTFKAQQKTLFARYKQQQPLKQLPTVEFTY